MALSTSSPALGAQPRELQPWLLDIYVPRPTAAMDERYEAARSEAGGSAMRKASAPAAPPAGRGARGRGRDGRRGRHRPPRQFRDQADGGRSGRRRAAQVPIDYGRRSK